ncbi:hypothetical protein [Xanthobacter sp. ZOL 2024]
MAQQMGRQGTGQHSVGQGGPAPEDRAPAAEDVHPASAAAAQLQPGAARADDALPNDAPVEPVGHRSRGAAALRGLGFLILAALMTVLVLLQQRAAGAYMAEFSATSPAEAGHVVTGLMLADYVAAGFPPLLAFISDFALHFPRVVLGATPPLYYLAEGAWILLLTAATPAILLLPAVLTALLVVTAGWATSRALGILPGLAVGAVLMVLPVVREATIVVGLELPLALLTLWALLAYAAYLARPGRGIAALFGLLAAAAALVHSAGLSLLLLPLIAALITGRLALARRFDFWLPFLVVLVVAGPWTIGTAPLVLNRLPTPLGAAALAAPGAVGAFAAAAIGGVLAGLAVIGGIAGWVRAPRHRHALAPAVLALGALLLAAGLGVLAAPVSPQAALPLCAPLVMLAAFGGMRLLQLLTRSWGTLSGLVVMLVLLLCALPSVLVPLHKPAVGMDGVAQTFLADPGAPRAILVVADVAGEGALIAAVAQRDRARQSFVVPGRMALAISGRGPAAGVPLETPDDVRPALEQLGVGYVALADWTDAADPLHTLLAGAIAAAPEAFRPLGSFPRADGRGTTRLYARVPASGAE